MAKVEFTRVETDEEVEDISIKDGQLIYSKSGKTYMDYGDERIPTGSGSGGGAEEVEISDTEPTDPDNKIWIDTGEVNAAATEITNEYSTSTGLGYSANYCNETYGGEVIWENPDITQAVTEVQLTDTYRRLEVIYQFAELLASHSTTIVHNDNTVVQTSAVIGDYNILVYTTCFYNTNTGKIKFENTYKIATYGTFTVDNNYMLPVKIIGYK